MYIDEFGKTRPIESKTATAINRAVERITRENPDVILVLEKGALKIYKQSIGLYDWPGYPMEKHRLLHLIELMTKMLSIDMYGYDGLKLFRGPFEEDMFRSMKAVMERHHSLKQEYDNEIKFE